MSEIHRVKNLKEALNLAKEFSDSGKYNFFRGQARNWPVTPSMARLNETDYKEGIEKLKRLFYFFETSEDLIKYQSNIDWFFAVAQHYGLPTSYIDFTTNYEIAAFFATNSKSNEIGKESVIVCLNEKDFNDFIEFSKLLYEKYKVVPPYICKIDVHNLWRLQAQEGVFLFTPFPDVEKLYDFDRIIFSFDAPYNGINVSQIYPEDKSELEIHLDYYFNNEERIVGRKRFRKFAEELKIPMHIMPDSEISDFLLTKENHKSWESKNHSKWKFAFLEDWKTLENQERITLNLPENTNSYQKFSEITMLHFKTVANNLKRNQTLNFVIDLNGNEESLKKLTKKIEKSCVRIWNGTRNLPFSNYEIYTIIKDYIFFEYYEYVHERVYSINNEELIVLELTNNYRSVTRCYARKSKIEEAFRNDIENILTKEFSGRVSSLILLNVNKPQIVFDFDKLLNLFKQEMIAYQVAYNSEKINPVIFYSPTELEILGYA